MIGTFPARYNSHAFTPERDVMLVLTIGRDSSTAVLQTLKELSKDKEYRITVDPPSKRKTIDQNAYLWALCDRIAQRIKSTKEEVYRELIRQVGVFDTVCVTDRALERFISNWQAKGVGWVADLTDSRIKGCTNVLCYYGTSCYAREQMSRLLDELVVRAKELNIPTEVNGYDYTSDKA